MGSSIVASIFVALNSSVCSHIFRFEESDSEIYVPSLNENGLNYLCRYIKFLYFHFYIVYSALLIDDHL